MESIINKENHSKHNITTLRRQSLEVRSEDFHSNIVVWQCGMHHSNVWRRELFDIAFANKFSKSNNKKCFN
ncbi:hypothetical protein V1478_012867 [Vespula squamosa]|uniref:Uncharacterized protein n=1 Tax=Vespula squamosa TaxID=30214 RepID=A0ABD2A964_VESSQ